MRSISWRTLFSTFPELDSIRSHTRAGSPNALGNLKDPSEEPKPEQQTGKKANRYTRWAALVLRTWATDPELCWQCGKTMVRSRTLFDPEELRRLLTNLKLGNYPVALDPHHRPTTSRKRKDQKVSKPPSGQTNTAAGRLGKLGRRLTRVYFLIGFSRVVAAKSAAPHEENRLSRIRSFTASAKTLNFIRSPDRLPDG